MERRELRTRVEATATGTCEHSQRPLDARRRLLGHAREPRPRGSEVYELFSKVLKLIDQSWPQRDYFWPTEEAGPLCYQLTEQNSPLKGTLGIF